MWVSEPSSSAMSRSGPTGDSVVVDQVVTMVILVLADDTALALLAASNCQATLARVRPVFLDSPNSLSSV